MTAPMAEGSPGPSLAVLERIADLERRTDSLEAENLALIGRVSALDPIKLGCPGRELFLWNAAGILL